jgi:predicted RNA-binding protein associated with RNAse of E/G family
VRLHYWRLPARLTVFEQYLVHEDDHVIVTFAEQAIVPRDIVVNEHIILEPGAPVIWFTFPGARHDIGRFHLRDDRFTGLYANLITPVQFKSRLEWETTDLFLDVWLGADGSSPILLDEDELESALSEGIIDTATAGDTRSEAQRLVGEWQLHSWPPTVVEEWSLARVRQKLSQISG